MQVSQSTALRELISILFLDVSLQFTDEPIPIGVSFSAPVLPGWNLTISNETLSSFSVQWTNLTALLGSQVEHFIILLKSSKNCDSIIVRKLVNGREEKTEMTGLKSSSQYTVEVLGIDEMGQPYRTLEVQAKTMTGKTKFT